MSAPVVALLLAACIPSEETFRAEADEAICDWKADCYSEDYEVCVDDAEGTWEPVDESCTYNYSQARECLTGLEQLECPQDLDNDFGFPSTCDNVWVCP